MKTIVKILFGSHLYGTDTPNSDLDYKSVFIPSSRDILLQRVRGAISTHRSKSEGEKNFAGELDEDAYSLQRYLELAAAGQTAALDMLFAPITDSSTWEWRAIQANRDRLITRKSAAFLGYCRQQANKYGIKGSRVAAALAALGLLSEALEQHGTVAKLGEIEARISLLVSEQDHMCLLDIDGATDVNGVRRSVRHWEVCNRKMPLTQTIKGAHGVLRRIVQEYGHRAHQAANNQNVDWKALSHAVRVGRQAIELLDTGFVQFPRPEAAHLREIKSGIITYTKVAKEIENLLVGVEQAAEKSVLPEYPDQVWIDEFVAEIYRNAVLDRT